MAAQSIAVRNLTLSTIVIQRAEVRETNTIPGTFAPGVDGPLDPSAHPCRVQHDIAIEILPSQICQIQTPALMSLSETRHLYIEINQQNHYLEMPDTGRICHALIPHEQDQHTRYCGIFHPRKGFLTVLIDGGPSSWMQTLRDCLPLSALSIPGTHNSAAHHHALPSVRCQAVSVADQLRGGIRFLDIRVQPKHPQDLTREELILVHGAFSVSSSHRPVLFRPVLLEILQFLDENPSETVILSLKREGKGRSTDAQLSRILHEHYANDHQHWYTTPRVPFVGEARGKIVLVRRFNLDESLSQEWGGAGWGIDAATWADNSPHSLCPSGQLCIQDYYQVMQPKSIAAKIEFAIEHLKKSAMIDYHTDNSQASRGDLMGLPFYINFLTASNLWHTGCWPNKIAAKLNPAILEYLCLHHHPKAVDSTHSSGSTGIVVCDFVGHHGDWDIVRCVIGMNNSFRKVQDDCK